MNHFDRQPAIAWNRKENKLNLSGELLTAGNDMMRFSMPARNDSKSDIDGRVLQVESELPEKWNEQSAASVMLPYKDARPLVVTFHNAACIVWIEQWSVYPKKYFSARTNREWRRTVVEKGRVFAHRGKLTRAMYEKPVFDSLGASYSLNSCFEITDWATRDIRTFRNIHSELDPRFNSLRRIRLIYISTHRQ